MVFLNSSALQRIHHILQMSPPHWITSWQISCVELHIKSMLVVPRSRSRHQCQKITEAVQSTVNQFHPSRTKANANVPPEYAIGTLRLSVGPDTRIVKYIRLKYVCLTSDCLTPASRPVRHLTHIPPSHTYDFTRERRRNSGRRSSISACVQQGPVTH